ncbi:MAG: hypothetical protein U0736_10770 [Gemmataceae bacterium]
MPTITAAEALAEFDRIDRRLTRKRLFVEAYLLRDAALRDPLAADGGTPAVLAAELAAIEALQERKVVLRRAIQAANERATVTLNGVTRPLADWLVWRREVASERTGFLRLLRLTIQGRRQLAAAHTATHPAGRDVIVHLDEKALMADLEAMETMVGELDGQITLRNTTGQVDVPDEVAPTAVEARFDELFARLPARPSASRPPWSDSPELCRLARDPRQKIAAIKLYRERTGVGLAEAKQAVEAFAAG